MVQILLRRASTLARACLEAAKKIEVETTVQISVHAFPVVGGRPYHAGSEYLNPMLEKASKNALAQLDQVLALYDARTAIRTLIGKANNEIISPLLAERDRLNLSETKITEVLTATTSGNNVFSRRNFDYDTSTSTRTKHDTDDVRIALKGLYERQSVVTTGAVSSHVSVPALSPKVVKSLEEQLARIRRKRADLNDNLAKANLNQHIELPPDVVKVLRDHGIIDPE